MKQVTGQQFQDALQALGFATEMFMDRHYFRPSFEWVRIFGQWCRRHPVEYEPELFDCDNITEQQVREADHANRIRTDATNVAKASDHTLVMCIVDIPTGQSLNGIAGPAPEQVAATGFDYARHATGIVWCDDGACYFIERQTGEYTHAQDAIDRGLCRPVYSRM